jgi:hypothetical protein
MLKKSKNMHNKQKKFFSINTGFMFILWNENNQISLVATATHEKYISIPLDENKYDL